jgi:uncharacterized protein
MAGESCNSRVSPAAALEWCEPRWTLRSHGRGSGDLFMKFAAIIEYTSDADKIGRVRPVHREYILGLKQRGQMAIAGPFTDDSGGLLVYEAETQEEVENFIRQDPFFKEGVFLSWVIRGWKPVTVNTALLPS